MLKSPPQWEHRLTLRSRSVLALNADGTHAGSSNNLNARRSTLPRGAEKSGTTVDYVLGRRDAWFDANGRDFPLEAHGGPVRASHSRTELAGRLVSTRGGVVPRRVGS